MPDSNAIRSLLAIPAVALALAGCGGSHSSSAPASSQRTGAAGAPAPGASGPFAWLHPGPLPAGWSAIVLRDRSATLPVPPGYRPIHTDPGTLSVALGGDPIRGYLNVTPKQGAETIAGWRAFRLKHNMDESKDVVGGVSATGLTFAGGASGSCLFDDYTSRHRAHRYREVACFVVAHKRAHVIVAAAPAAAWTARSAALEAAISAFSAP